MHTVLGFLGFFPWLGSAMLCYIEMDYSAIKRFSYSNNMFLEKYEPGHISQCNEFVNLGIKVSCRFCSISFSIL
jgi:hypothetical protein